MKRRYFVTIVMLVFLCAITTVNAAQTTIRVGHKWAETHNMHLSLQAAATAFETKFPNIKVEVVPAWVDDKFKMSVAAGDAPDVQVLTEIPTWGATGFIQPIDILTEKYGVSRKDIMPPALNRNTWRNKLYALPISVDPNFALFWNKTLNAEAGLNPDAAPKTITELDQYNKRLTKIEADGTAIRVGYTPWTILGGNANTVFTWGWLFGGSWFDYAANKTTAHHPGNIKAFEYLTGYFERYNDAVTALGKGIPSGMSRFSSGREAMFLSNPSTGLNTVKANPDMKIGIASMFNNPEEGVENATWIGGWDIALVSGSKNVDAALQFIKFISTDPAGVEAFCGTGSFMTGAIRTPYLKSLGRDPLWQVFTESIVTAVNYKPAIPNFGTYSNKLGALLPQAIRRQVTAAGALEEISKQIDIDLANYVK